MEPNPYESPDLNDEIPAATKVDPQVRWFAIFLFAEPCLLLLASGLHRLQLDLNHPSDAYRTSPLIAVEGWGLLLAFLVFLLASYTALMFAISRRERLTLLFGSIAVFALLAAFAAMMIDAPTLVFGT